MQLYNINNNNNHNMATTSSSGILLSQITKSRNILANRFASNSLGIFECHAHEIQAMIDHNQLDMTFTPEKNTNFKLGDYVHISLPDGAENDHKDAIYKIIEINPTTKECTVALDVMQIYGTIVGTYSPDHLIRADVDIKDGVVKKRENIFKLSYLQQTVLPSNTPNKIYVKYMLNSSLNKEKLDEIREELFDITETLQKTDVLYIISKAPPNETIINKLKDIWDRYKIFIVVECIANLQFDILSHSLVPQHIIMDDAETEFVMKKFNITHLSQFPEISRFDPVARAICLRPGQVCRIIRPSKTSITTDYFRLCV